MEASDNLNITVEHWLAVSVTSQHDYIDIRYTVHNKCRSEIIGLKQQTSACFQDFHSHKVWCKQ